MSVSRSAAAGRRAVAVTAVGVISAFGRGPERLSEGLRSGRSALSPLQAFDAMGLPVGLTAEVREALPELEGFADDRKASLAVAAARDAWAQARPPEGARTGVWMGTGLSSVTPRELEEDAFPYIKDGQLDRAAVFADLHADRVAPRRHLPERITAQIARELGARGPVRTSFSACAAGALAIAEGAWAVRRGEVDVAVCGGHDAMIHPLGVLSFIVLGALSPQRCRPFDRGRDGFSIGEGAAVLILEDEQRARARGATILARILGAGSSVDAWNVTAPHPEGSGAYLSMRRALADAGLEPSAVDHVNAHGTGTPLGDRVESLAIQRLFGDRVPVSSIKGALGHCIAAAGAVEAAAGVVAVRGGFSPGTPGLEEEDELGVPVQRQPQEDRPRVLLSNSFGFGGQNCTLLIGAADPGAPAPP
ncbi:MAG: beta-ketoacyl-[acyl-carrier-protein] synthase family protein [Alphaproteobacteria bacterium]|nr:beta-ketoacyl-[acyl-carrier-protein] synthase family protein [Alphaproteobacteria bacterium]